MAKEGFRVQMKLINYSVSKLILHICDMFCKYAKLVHLATICIYAKLLAYIRKTSRTRQSKQNTTKQQKKNKNILNSYSLCAFCFHSSRRKPTFCKASSNSRPGGDHFPKATLTPGLTIKILCTSQTMSGWRFK